MTSNTINLGSIEKIPAGQGRCFVVDGEEIAVFRQRDGRLFATQNRCPHRDGPLAEGVMGSGQVVCPLHSHKFNLATGEGGQQGECLKIYCVSESNGEILLRVS
jgi:nitrite reductase (NADH) small subunit